METVGALQRLVASTLILEGYQDYHRREALLTRCRDLLTSGIENMESRLEGRLETFAQVDKLSELATEEIKRIEAVERERMVAQVTDGEVDKDVRQMRGLLDHFFKKEVPFWMLFARSGEISERMHELWTAGAFAETEHRVCILICVFLFVCIRGSLFTGLIFILNSWTPFSDDDRWRMRWVGCTRVHKKPSGQPSKQSTLSPQSWKKQNLSAAPQSSKTSPPPANS